jgi:6-phosphofructokinase 1
MLIPEILLSMQKICEILKQRESWEKFFTIIVVAEGVKLPPEMKHMAGGSPIGNLIGNFITLLSRQEVRVKVPGHIQRSGSPSPYDRIVGTRFGVAAVDLISAGGFRLLLQPNHFAIRAVNFADAVSKMKVVDPNGEIANTARAIGIRIGD